MTVHIINGAAAAGAAALGVNNTVTNATTPAKAGNLNGRRVIPIAFYLLVGTSIIALIATIALAAIQSWPYAIAAGGFAITQIISAISLYRSSAAKTRNEAVDKLSTQVTDLTSVNDNLKVEIAQEKAENAKLNADIRDLEENQEKKLRELTDIKNKIVAYANSHKADKEALRNNLDSITDFLKGNGKDVSGLEQMKTDVQDIELEKADFENIQKCLEEQTEENTKFMAEVQAALKAIKDYTTEFTADVKKLAAENNELEQEIASEKKIDKSMEENLEATKKLLETRTHQLNDLTKELARTMALLKGLQDQQATPSNTQTTAVKPKKKTNKS
jgi:septal ring factor EnvC (AmiA/AmiB activator)